MPVNLPWRLELGASLLPEGVQFCVWAPQARRVEVVLMETPSRSQVLQRQADGLWCGLVADCGAGTLYAYRLDDAGPFPDPYARHQPQGVHGPSEVIDPTAYTWYDQDWPGLSRRGLVIYECHIGTATPAGTCEALCTQLPRLQDLGVTALELMPVVPCAGRRNWGYDGVSLFAVSANYGGPEALKRLVDAAHQHGLGVIVDVVYNHFGPEGNYLTQFAAAYASARYRTPWGEAWNYDGADNAYVRRLAMDNACYWLHEYHMDGLRLDSTPTMRDRSQPHILQDLTQTVRASLPPTRQVVLIAETSTNDIRYLQPPEAGGYGFDMVWCDDFAWSLQRYLTGDHEGRYQDYRGTLDEVAHTINQGFLYEGQWSGYRRQVRGTPARQQPAWQLQYCVQHHDHVGNRAFGERLHHRLDLARYRVASALLLLLPYTPLLFMGEEFVASSPFQFFTDHGPDLGAIVAAGRRREFAAYTAFADPIAAARIPDPQAEATFGDSILPLDDLTRSPGTDMQRLYQALLHLRRTDDVLQRQERHILQAQALTPDLLSLTWNDPGPQRWFLANFGAAHSLPLTTPSPWHVLLETTDKRFGGDGVLVRIAADSLQLPAHSAVVLASG
jgi:maltooligosyltrehalose trehalohydrolase